MKLFLNCWVVGSDPETAFFVDIEENTYVSQLKDLIKEKRAPHLNHVAASDLQLWQVSIPSDDLEQELENINFAGYTKLPSGKKLAAFFTNVEDDRLHVIAKAPVIQTAPILSPTRLLSLNCFVLGGTHNQNFIVDIEENKYVSHLKDMIKEKRAPHLNHVAASDLQLWQVSIPVDDLEKELGNVNFARLTELPPSKELSAFFTNVERGRLQVIAKTPLLSLNCFLLGDDSDRSFTIEISKDKSVNILKTLIKEKNPSTLGNVDLKDIELWQVSFPIDDLSTKNPPIVGPKMRSERSLSDLFRSELNVSCIHVVVRTPVNGAPLPRPPPSAFTHPVVSTTELGRDREKFCSQRKSEAPSNGGKPQEFQNAQQTDQYIQCNRPHGVSSALPLSLLHPIFGKFTDDAENYVPTPDDAQFLLAFVQAMAEIYKKEGGRQDKIHAIFNDYKIPIKGTKIGNFSTDGDLSFGEYRFLIAEFKNEIGSMAAEPLFQAILYFLEATRKFATRHLNSVLPCIIVLVFGPYIAFAGAAWTNRPVVQMLSPAIPCHYHNTDIKMESMLVRHLGALRQAIHALDAYYQDYNANPASPLRNPTHPYPTSFKSRDGLEIQFKYLLQMQGRNLFFCSTDDSKVCIKFVPRYCEAGHEFLAARGFAPKLHAVERLPGGLFMVVMDDVSVDYANLFNLKDDDLLSEERQDARESLSQRVRGCLQEFHQAGFVHGDIRDTNIMVKKNLDWSDGRFLVVDFDSCGHIDEARYTFDLNTTSVKRPDGAVGGAVIETEHDMDMLDHIWDPVPLV